MSINKNPTNAQLAAALWAVENPTNDGYNAKTKKYGKFPDPNGVDWLIGPGLKIGDTVEDREYTKAELDKIAATYSRKSLESIGKSYNEVYGTKDFPTPFDTVSVAPKMLMNDVRFRVGRLPQSGYPKLYQAVADGDWAKAIQESRTKFQNNGVWLPDNDRVRRVAETYFPGMFDVSYKPGSWDPVNVRPKKLFGGHRSLAEIGTKEYIVQKGDTLSAISKRLTGDAGNYLQLAKASKIENPDRIQIGQKIIIPDKIEGTVKFDTLPNADRKHIITNYKNSPYNYFVSGDKVYMSRKNRDAWVDISDNDVARKNLLNFIHDNNLPGYNNGEEEIRKQVNEGTFNYRKYRAAANEAVKRNIEKENLGPVVLPTDGTIFDVANISTNFASYPTNISVEDNSPIINDELYRNINKDDNTKVASSAKQVLRRSLEIPYDIQPNVEKNDAIQFSIDINKKPHSYNITESHKTVKDYIEEYAGVLKRQYNKYFSDADENSVYSSLPQQKELDSEYGILPQSYVGDTIMQGNRQYITPEYINTQSSKFGVRNRGDYNQINTEGGVITAMHPFVPYGSKNSRSIKGFKTFIGIDKNGNLKAGPYENFKDGDYLTGTWYNDITEFARDENGNRILKNDSKHGNSSRSIPGVRLYGSDKVAFPFNVLTGKDNGTNTYGNVTGGRVLAQVDNELVVLSGSIDDIEAKIMDMKKRHGSDYVRLYTLDNGSYNRGLRTKDGVLTQQDLRKYDSQNGGDSGNFLYLMPRTGYASDTILTPNIRTEKSESYKKGHSLTNERKGITLHHTAFMENDLTNITRHLTDPKTESSSHVVIGYDGSRRVLATPDKVTFHAGESVWNGRGNVNDFMIGVEFQGDTNKKDLTKDQINSVVEYLEPIIRENNIKLEDITTHEEVRRLYNDYAKKSGVKPAAEKHDINFANYKKVIEALKNKIYYKKKRSLED